MLCASVGALCRHPMENIHLYEELGRDSTSVVYKGRRIGSLNYVALKCIDKAKRPEITNHVRLCQYLDHPNIVRFYEWYETRKHLWLVVELCTGGTLESVIIRDRCLPEDVARKFGWDLVQGLEHIHKLGIIFSDLTPAKILLDSSGMLKLEAGNRKYETKHQDIMVKKRFQGSPIYMAPEILQGSETTSISDLWALGCVLYYMYTGKPPFYSSCYSQLKEMILCQEAASPTQKVSPTIPPSQDFQHLLKRLLNKNPEKRGSPAAVLMIGVSGLGLVTMATVIQCLSIPLAQPSPAQLNSAQPSTCTPKCLLSLSSICFGCLLLQMKRPLDAGMHMLMLLLLLCGLMTCNFGKLGLCNKQDLIFLLAPGGLSPKRLLCSLVAF
ncbi:serine/threonine-protein kinase ULK4-like isoform X2 [Syngnathus scovelli]|uniref:serine/threonine-protein kinase ULK4-like isoform X2 n=1 Tax=Syngnathus scovelli TaxID=161590 RepID=UPI0021108B33|nr:serine/threonine-protein kinase ULK4-like isoform X2 [Syngnathus scovelli]